MSSHPIDPARPEPDDEREPHDDTGPTGDRAVNDTEARYGEDESPA